MKRTNVWVVLATVVGGLWLSGSGLAGPAISDSFDRADNPTGLGSTDQGYAWGITGSSADYAPGIKDGRLWWSPLGWNMNGVAYLSDPATKLKNFVLDLDFVTNSIIGGSRPLTVHFRMPEPGALIYRGDAPAGYAVGIQQFNYFNVTITLSSNYGAGLSKLVNSGGPGAHLGVVVVDNTIKVLVNNVEELSYTDTTSNPAANAAGYFSFYDGNADDQQGMDNLVIQRWPLPAVSDGFNRPDSARDLGTTDQGYAWQVINWNGINDWAPGIKDGRMWWGLSGWNTNNPITLTNSEAVMKNFRLELDFATNSITGGWRPLSINFRTPQGIVLESGALAAGYSVMIRQKSYFWTEVGLYNPGYGIDQKIDVDTGGPGCHVTVVAVDNTIKVFINHSETPAIDYTDTTANPGKNAYGYFAFYTGNADDQQGFDNLEIYNRPMTPAPTFSRKGGNLGEPKTVTLSCTAPDAVIRYTTDTTEPSESNGTAVSSGASILVDHTLTLKARAWAGGLDGSDTTSETYTFPTTFNRPVQIAPGTASIDGEVGEWAPWEWVLLNQTYNLDGSSEEALQEDIRSAYYAARWSSDAVYVAVKVKDAHHFFTDDYSSSNGRDAVEIYIHTTNTGPVAYWENQLTAAQQYALGVKDTDHSQHWAVVGATRTPEAEEFTAKATLGPDGWIYYEARITPFEYFGGFSGLPSVVSPLSANDVVGLDVVVVGNNAGAYAGMRSENTMTGKWNDYSLFGLHKLVASLSVIAGDANRDGKVDVSDLGILAAHYGMTEGAVWDTGDFNGDGKVDVSDLGILAANYGTGAGTALDFNADAKALGLAAGAEAKAETTESVSGLCGTAGLPLVVGLLLMGMWTNKSDE